jgi:hypothetical protein
MSWWDEPLLLTSVAGLAAIGGAIAGAWWAGRIRAETARDDRLAFAQEGAAARHAAAEVASQDRRHSANIAAEDRLYARRNDVIDQLSKDVTTSTEFFVDGNRLNDVMTKALEAGDTAGFFEAQQDFETVYEDFQQTIDSHIQTRTMRTTIYLEPPSADRAWASYLGVARSHKGPLRILTGAGDRSADMSVNERMQIMHSAQQARLAYIHKAGNHLNLLMILLAEIVNPSMATWYEKHLEVPGPQSSASQSAEGG